MRPWSDDRSRGRRWVGRPLVKSISGTYPADIKALFGRHLKELRMSTIRILFKFGPDHIPVLIFAGDKVGDWNRWYPPAIKEAARLYRAYLDDL